MKFNSKRIALLAMLTALASITFIIEGLFPPLFIPGAKMGLSNIFGMLAVVLLSPLDAIILVAVRTTLGSLIVGSLSSWLYSFFAGVASIVAASVLYKFFADKISLVAISVAAAVIHNIAQNTIFCIITQTPELYAYLPYLALIGVVAGAIVGVAVILILRYVPFERMFDIRRKNNLDSQAEISDEAPQDEQ